MMKEIEVKIGSFKHGVNKNVLEQFEIKLVRNKCRQFKLINNKHNANDIHTIFFERCFFQEFPRAQILLDLVKNLKSLKFSECNLKTISGKDLRGLGTLKELYVTFDTIETLPKGLFQHTPNLEIVSFEQNRIKEVGENILDPLKNLKFFDLSNNFKINVKFDSINNKGNVTLEELKKEIKKCRPIEGIINDLRRENNSLREEFAVMKMSDQLLRKEVTELRAELNKLKPFNFTVVVNGKEFKVNKDILSANSPVLAKLITDSQEPNRLELDNVSEKIFEEILNFMVAKIPPREDSDLIECFSASARLEMKDLMDLTASILMEKVNPENALHIIIMCEKYNHVELNKKALSELNKKFDEN